MNSFDELKLKIYESHNDNNISSEQRDQLLEQLSILQELKEDNIDGKILLENIKNSAILNCSDCVLEYILDVITESNIDGMLIDKGYHLNTPDAKKFSKYIRMVDVLQSKLKRKAISKLKFHMEYKAILKKASKDLGYKVKEELIPKTGSASNINYARPNKEKSPMKPEDFGAKGELHRHAKDLDPVTAEKIQRHLDICRRTDDYNEYKQHHTALMKLIGANKDSVVMAGAIEPKKQNGEVSLVCLAKDKQDTISTKDRKMLHTTKVSGLTHLIPKFRASDGALYPNKRVYFHADKIGDRMGGSGDLAKDDKVYQYTGKEKTAKNDLELNALGGGTAHYIETKDKLPVKEVKKEEIDKKDDNKKNDDKKDDNKKSDK